MHHEFDPTTVTHAHTRMDPGKAQVVFHIAAEPGQTVTISKWLAYHYGKAEPTELADRVAADPRPCAHPGLRRCPRRSPTPRHQLLGSQRAGLGGSNSGAAGSALQPLQSDAGLTPRGGSWSTGQGPDGNRLRRPLLLGHRGLPVAVSHPHLAGGGPQPADAPDTHAAGRATPRPRGGLLRRAVPLAHHQRRGGIRQLRSRHRAVSHRRRHRLRLGPVRTCRR